MNGCYEKYIYIIIYIQSNDYTFTNNILYEE